MKNASLRSRQARRKPAQVRPNTQERDPDEDAKIAFWVVGFLDMLGYRSVLNRLDVFPLPEPDSPEHVALVKNFRLAIDIRQRLHGQVTEFLDGINRRSSEFEGLPPELLKLARSVQQARTWLQLGPDHLVLASTLAPASDHFPLRGVYNMVAATAAAMLYQLALGADSPDVTLPLRGGIELAVGVRTTSEDFVYSPALTHAYDLEHKHAVYPRTIAGPRFLQFLQTQSDGDSSNFLEGYQMRLAHRIRALFFDDADGQVALDFMGDAVRSLFSDSGFAEQLGSRTWRFVLAASRAAKQKGDGRVLAKYEWLFEYLRPRIILWGVKP